HGRYARNDLFGVGTAGRDIAEVLATVNPPVQKRLHYDSAELLTGRNGVNTVPNDSGYHEPARNSMR
ncbi:MAG TPA: hypothetical protein VF788_10035, partial [Pseudonocardiaceae bacterium]